MPMPPEFDQFVEFVDEQGVHPVALAQHSLDVLPTLQALDHGYQHVAQLGRRTTLSAADVDNLKVSLEVSYRQDVIDNEVITDDPAQIVANLLNVRNRPEWRPGIDVLAADRERTIGVYFWDGGLWRCVQPHRTQRGWEPGAPGTSALWVSFYELEQGPQPWVQPTGAHDAYNTGDLVTHDGQTWKSAIDANVWEPGSVGAEDLWENMGPVGG